MNENKELAEKTVALLKKKKLTLSSAESMTGGMFAKVITDIPGTSAVFDRGLVTYSNAAKESELDVDPETIESFGAISAETAREMVEGLRIYSGCDVCIAVTGNAGPDPAEGKAVGLYYIGLYCKGQTSVLEIRSRCKTRNSIRTDACNTMLELIYEHIK